MRAETKERIHFALETAAELIRCHTEGGDMEPEDVNEVDWDGWEEYKKATKKAAKLIETLAKRYQ
jgi:hypothetical protein